MAHYEVSCKESGWVEKAVVDAESADEAAALFLDKGREVVSVRGLRDDYLRTISRTAAVVMLLVLAHAIGALLLVVLPALDR